VPGCVDHNGNFWREAAAARIPHAACPSPGFRCQGPKQCACGTRHVQWAVTVENRAECSTDSCSPDAVQLRMLRFPGGSIALNINVRMQEDDMRSESDDG
jgi:hypothetical protein